MVLLRQVSPVSYVALLALKREPSSRSLQNIYFPGVSFEGFGSRFPRFVGTSKNLAQ